MRLTIDHLPIVYMGEEDGAYRHTLRHWLTLDDGRIFFQDEVLDARRGELYPVSRSEWAQLPTPPMTWDCVGLLDHGGLPMALLRNGEAYIFGTEPGESIPRWAKFAEPVPGSHASLDLDGDAG